MVTWCKRPSARRPPTDRAVDVLGDGLVRGLVLAADSQPDVAFVPLYQPAVTPHHAGQVEERQCREQEVEQRGGQAESAGHGFGSGAFGDCLGRKEGGSRAVASKESREGEGQAGGVVRGQRGERRGASSSRRLQLSLHHGGKACPHFRCSTSKGSGDCPPSNYSWPRTPGPPHAWTAPGRKERGRESMKQREREVGDVHIKRTNR